MGTVSDMRRRIHVDGAINPGTLHRPYHTDHDRADHTAGGTGLGHLARSTALTMAVGLAFVASGCSVSYKLESLFGSDKESAPDHTASAAQREATPEIAGLTGSDLALAKAAASEAVTRSGKDVSVPWENPTTGARGTVTPLAAAYTQNGFTCRDFLASYVRQSSQAWLEGEACRMEAGDWEVRNLKPWKHS
jgi:surface antigen